MTAVCFDLDGTLFDDRTYVEAGFRSAAAYLSNKYEIDTFGDMVWEYAIRRNFKTVFDQIIESYGLPQEEVDYLVSAYHSSDPELRPYPEVETILTNLPKECQTAVITGGKHGEKKLRKLGLSNVFDEVYVAPDNKTSKRQSTPFETVLKRLEVCPKHAVFVGDNPELDFYWPNDLGMLTVWVRRQETLFQLPESNDARPQYVLPDLTLIPEIVNILKKTTD
ncbi:HAD family hydrolase [Halorubrum ejinorense]|uniref:HAD family hydrolase n=1 Tax=Halorubrum ejinorense TaxID=425309 RepID=A0AAV3SUM5_9EURY